MPEDRPTNKYPAWIQITGDGLAVAGPCLLKHVIFWPDADADYTDIYDGRDTTTGKKFCRIETATQNTRHVSLGQGIRFDAGIYVDGKDAATETTVIFTPLDF